jgi:hypothetical protein
VIRKFLQLFFVFLRQSSSCVVHVSLLRGFCSGIESLLHSIIIVALDSRLDSLACERAFRICLWRINASRRRGRRRL